MGNIPDNQSGDYPSYCLTVRMLGAIGLTYPNLDFTSVVETVIQHLIRSVRFMQVELPKVRSCHIQ